MLLHERLNHYYTEGSFSSHSRAYISMENWSSSSLLLCSSFFSTLLFSASLVLVKSVVTPEQSTVCSVQTGVSDPDPHVFGHLNPDPHKICGSRIRIQGDQIHQNRQKSFIEMNHKNRYKSFTQFHIILSLCLPCVISHKLMNSTHFSS